MQILVHKIAAKIFQTGLYANKLIRVIALIKVKTCTQTSEGMKKLMLSIKHGYALATSQSAFTCSKLTIEALEDVIYVQS